MEKQNLFTEEELAKVTDEAERKHLIECAQDQSKIDMKYMEIMNKYDLWEKGEHSRYFHATTHENAEKIMQDGMIRKRNGRRRVHLQTATRSSAICRDPRT